MDGEEAFRILRSAANAIPMHMSPFLLGPGIPRPPGPLATTWCSCGRCSNMSDARMNICCNSQECITLQAEFTNLCLRYDVISIVNILNWGYMTHQETSMETSIFRNQAYRNFILWQHGKLGRGIRKRTPSCVVLAIRNRFPAPDEVYRGYHSIDSDAE
jgi:hypothetical protein